ncbi:amino acid/amide ABC transporter ATP-binding protein 2, HAAT family [Poseidonocella pacifica]|uniref:Amino acid/amide ABC transporter ATP-binding protein 2, HAAT family n=1 Tax=Poseidonocella pacifica TaxID=871651 RepID=A0A1I0WGF2_9RHOB|nr:ABC transporter ATP-binding protein [Poseidonocella pacifica]SFA87721.1 amino acid/amide ABC transporter ATP-binding protein 2, HAAT family [Poseidonocella pacifica]
MSLLTLEGVTGFYGGAQALFGLDMALSEGEVLALMGRNGMGKTTTVRAICRLLPRTEGRIVFAGQDLLSLPPHRAARLGIGLVPEGRRVFRGLTVEENLTVAARSGHWTLSRVATLFPRLAERREQSAETLSGGEQQMLAIGRALMTNPRLLILDEATEGLAPTVRAEIRSGLAALRDTGLSILLIDKSVAEIAEIADRIMLIEKGRAAWGGAPSELGPEIQHRYLGL